MKIQVFRLAISPYQDELFIEEEAKIINSIPGVQYIRSLSALERDSNLVLISNTHVEPDKIAHNLLEKTVLMIHSNSGHECFSDEFKKKINFPIITGNDIRSNAVAEYILSAIFHRLTPIKNHLVWDQARTWNRKRLMDQKVVILGFGHIGQILYQALKALVKKIIVIDPKIEDEQMNSFFYSSINENNLKETDILIVASELTKSSRDMIDMKVFDLLNHDAVIINAARGKIIKESDLEIFLTTNPDAFAYLDVFANEPFQITDFKNIKNLNKTSHMAGVFKNLNIEIIKFEKRIITDFIENSISFKSKHSEHIL